MISYEGFDEIIKKVYTAGQDHLFSEWDLLKDDEKKNLLNELASVDFNLKEKLFREKDMVSHREFEPAPYIRVPSTEEEHKEHRRAVKAGESHIRKGGVAAFVVAGGQGSRLGYDGPKGKFPIGPVSGKSLFQIHAEKIVKYSRKYEVPIPFLIMTSEENHDETVSYFKQNGNFGIADNDVFIFPQNMIPSLDSSGNLLLKGKSNLFRNPDGHGGSLTALHTSGSLSKLAHRGVDLISYFQVDNPLAKIVDPAFIGYHVLNRADISSKALKKAYPEEKIGVFVQFDNSRIGVIEYSDLSEEKTRSTDNSGQLAYIAGSIAIHLFSRQFVEKLTAGTEISLPFHTAKKKLKIYERGTIKEVEGLKFEKFVFDALLLTDNNIILETLREEEFAPVKNPSGVDSAQSSQQLMSDLYKSWLTGRGIAVSEETKMIEISPLLAVEPGDLDPSLNVPGKESVYLE